MGITRHGLLLLSLLALTGARCSTEPTDARLQVRNLSELTFDSVRIGFPSVSIDFQDVPAGAATAFVPVEHVYRYGYVKVWVEDGRTFVLQPIDWVGEEPLGAGDYAYELDVDGESLSGEVVFSAGSR